MTNEEIQKIALSHGFKLKEQPDGSMALNPYVFEFANTLLYKVIPKLVKANGIIDNLLELKDELTLNAAEDRKEIERLQAEVKLAQASERKAAENNVKLIEENLRLKRSFERVLAQGGPLVGCSDGFGTRIAQEVPLRKQPEVTVTMTSECFTGNCHHTRQEEDEIPHVKVFADKERKPTGYDTNIESGDTFERLATYLYREVVEASPTPPERGEPVAELVAHTERNHALIKITKRSATYLALGTPLYTCPDNGELRKEAERVIHCWRRENWTDGMPDLSTCLKWLNDALEGE